VLTQITDLVRADGAIELITSYEPGDGEPWPFYQKFGFEPTGEIDDGEIVLRLTSPLGEFMPRSRWAPTPMSAPIGSPKRSR